MNCFNHRENVAIAVCKTCGRAMCTACAQDLGFAVACNETCAREAAELNEINRRAKRIYGVGDAPKNFPLGAAIWGSFAILFVGFGTYDLFHDARLYWFPLLFGVLSATISVTAYRRAKAMQINM